MSSETPSNYTADTKIKMSIIYIIIFISGGISLVYELIWERFLRLTFGISVYSVAIITASFMAGLGIGYYLFGKIADKTQNPLKLYGFLHSVLFDINLQLLQ